MLLWHCIFVLLWETTPVFAVNLAKIEPQIFHTCSQQWVCNVYVSFGSTQPALEAAKRARSSRTNAERAGNVRSYLINLAQREQAGVLNLLSSRNKDQFESLWVTNRIFIKRPDIELIKEISDFSNVTYIKEEVYEWGMEFTQRFHEASVDFPSSNFNQNATTGLELIHAPEAWKVLGGASKAGEGIIVGVLDTGAYAGHETLIENFVGMNYGYFDGIQEPVLDAVAMIQGTYITGTIVGRNGIGVAPAAKHSQCRACTQYECSGIAFEKCIAFFICPTLQNGTQPDCSRRVHVIHLSFGSFLPTIKPIVDAAISAGIILVTPMGVKWYHSDNCKEGTYPGLFDEVIAVGVVNNTDHLYERSIKGPNPNSLGNPKPDVVAPGVDIVSAHYKDPNYKYLAMNGSLIATAHVTGLVALLLTRDKTLTQDQVRKIIIENTDRPVPNVWGCDNKTRNTWPNPEFGYGRINALKALNAQTLMLTGTNKNESKLENTCDKSFENYKKHHHDTLKNLNSVNIEIRKDIQRSIMDLEVIAHGIDVFNATLKTLLNEAEQLEKSLKALVVN